MKDDSVSARQKLLWGAMPTPRPFLSRGAMP